MKIHPSAHYTYWKSVKTIDNFKKMIDRVCPSDSSTLVFVLSRLLQFYKTSPKNNSFYTFFRSVENKIRDVPSHSWISRDLSSIALSLSYFKHWITLDTLSYMLKSIRSSVYSFNLLDVSHVLYFLSTIRGTVPTEEINDILSNISNHILQGNLLKTSAMRNVLHVLSAYAKLDIAQPLILRELCREINNNINQLTKSYEICDALNSITRVALKSDRIDPTVITFIDSLILKVMSFEDLDEESFADFLDSVSRLISHSVLDLDDQLLKIFAQSINRHKRLLMSERPKVLRVYLRSIRNINFKLDYFISHCIENYKKQPEEWSFGGLCDLISTIGQLDSQKEFIKIGITKDIFDNLALKMHKHKFIPSPETLTNLSLICQFDNELLHADSLIIYLLNLFNKANSSANEHWYIAAFFILHNKPELLLSLNLRTLTTLSSMRFPKLLTAYDMSAIQDKLIL